MITKEEREKREQEISNLKKMIAGRDYFPTNRAARKAIGTDAYDYIMALFTEYLWWGGLNRNGEFATTRKRIEESTGLSRTKQIAIEKSFLCTEFDYAGVFKDLFSVVYDEHRQVNHYKFNPYVWAEFVRMCESGSIKVIIIKSKNNIKYFATEYKQRDYYDESTT